MTWRRVVALRKCIRYIAYLSIYLTALCRVPLEVKKKKEKEMFMMLIAPMLIVGGGDCHMDWC